MLTYTEHLLPIIKNVQEIVYLEPSNRRAVSTTTSNQDDDTRYVYRVKPSRLNAVLWSLMLLNRLEQYRAMGITNVSIERALTSQISPNDILIDSRGIIGNLPDYLKRIEQQYELSSYVRQDSTENYTAAYLPIISVFAVFVLYLAICLKKTI